MSPYEVLMNAPFHETPATSDLLDCDLKYDADTLEHFSSPFPLFSDLTTDLLIDLF